MLKQLKKWNAYRYTGKIFFFPSFFFLPPIFFFLSTFLAHEPNWLFPCFRLFSSTSFLLSLSLSLSLSSFFLTLKKLQILCKAFPLPANSLYPFSGSQTHGTKAFSTKAWNESRGNRDPFENVNIVSSKGRNVKKKMFDWKKKIKFVEKYRGSTFVTI